MRRFATRSPRCGRAARTATRKKGLLKQKKSTKSRWPTSVAKPELTDSARPATFEVEAYNEAGEMVPTAIAGEHPLTLYLDKREIVTLMTLGHAPEALVIGYLRNQRLVDAIDDIASVQVDWDTSSAAVVTRRQKEINLDKKTVTSGCGQGTMLGNLMEEIDQIKLRKDVFLEDGNLFQLIDKVR